ITPYRGDGGGPNRTVADPLPATHPVRTTPERAAPKRRNLFISQPPKRVKRKPAAARCDSKVLLTLYRINARRRERWDTGWRRSADDEVSLDFGFDGGMFAGGAGECAVAGRRVVLHFLRSVSADSAS